MRQTTRTSHRRVQKKLERNFNRSTKLKFRLLIEALVVFARLLALLNLIVIWYLKHSFITYTRREFGGRQAL